MTNQSLANNPTGPSRSQIPEIRSFQFDKAAIGDIKSSVNYFRGNIQLPIDFLTLTGREGLEVKVSAMYSSTIKKQVTTWNSEAPTSVLGLGWDMPLNYIEVYKASSGSVTSDTYYLVANGSANPLVKTQQISSTVWAFQTRNYEFWDIQYDTLNETWQIIKEDGFVYSYGSSSHSNAIQYGVKWGNWIGSSNQLAGQEQYCAAWNLASIESPWGHRVTYTYHNVEQSVGSGGQKFTQASYVKTLVDSYGRTITFNYGEKYGVNNPSQLGILEYQAANAQFPEPNAYQDRYETLFLDSVDVSNADGLELYRLKCVYDFVNTAVTSDPAYNLLWKRCLKSVYQYAADGTSLPGMQFEYAEQNEVNPGALKSVTYPSGGIAHIKYKKNFINAPKRVTVTNPLPGSTPGVWHGDDYVVFTFCQPDKAGINVLVRSWDGRWVESDITAPNMNGIQADPKSVTVLTQTDFIAVSLRNQNASQDEIYIYQRDKTGFGGWTLYNQQPFLLRLNANAGASIVTAGTDFVIAYNQDYAVSAIQGFSYSWKTQQWTSPSIGPDIGGETGATIAALQNYYIVVRYFHDQQRAEFQILYRDLENNWQRAQSWTVSSFDVVESEGRLLFAVAPNPTYVAVTHVTLYESSKISYRIDSFDWNEGFDVLNARNPAQVDLESPIDNGKSVYNVFRTLTTGSFVNNNIANLRKLGEYGNNAGVQWVQQEFTKPAASSTIQTAAGEDFALLCETANTVQKNQLLTFNPNFPTAGWQFPSVTNTGSYPTASSNYLTVGKTIYHRNFEGQWLPMRQELSNLRAEETVQNQGPNYIAYQDTATAGSKTYFVALKNGQVSTPTELPGGAQRIYVPTDEACVGPGTNLAGPRFLISYASTSFCDADKLYLQNLDEGDIQDYAYDYPVAYVEIEDAYDSAQSFSQSYFYANSSDAQIGYNTQTGLTQYPLVYEVPGIQSASDSPPSTQPDGRSERYFSNGLSPQRGLYPTTWVYNYQYLLNGMLLAQKDFDADNNLVSSQLNYWQVFTNDANASSKLYGGYARLMRQTAVIDGVISDSTSTYDETTGVQLWQEQQYYDSEGTAKKLRSETKYAWQVPAYKSTFLNQHIYTAVVEETQSVIDDNADTRNYINSEVTTYRNWAEQTPSIQCLNNAGDSCKLAPYQKYTWTTPGSSPPEFDFLFGAERPGWLLTTEILQRSQTEGVIEEQRDVNGVSKSFLYDQFERYKVAEFPDGSLTGDEISYYGFESYEGETGWALGAGAQIVPNAEDTVVDAHTGSYSLKLSASTTGNAGISQTFLPARQGISYIFSAWVKKPEGFDKDKGNSCWQIDVAGGQTITLEFPDTVGQWVYVYQVFNVPDDTTGVTISGENFNSASDILIDDIRFSPLSCQFEGTGYNVRLWLPNAGLGANGESDRKVHSRLLQSVIETNSADLVTKLTSQYFSRSGNQGKFVLSDPNKDVTLRAAAGGSLYTFNRGSEWQQLWQAQSNVWVVEAEYLTQKTAGLSGTLSITDTRYRSDYMIDVGFATLEAVSQPLGIRFGQLLAAQWNPKTLVWELLDCQDESVLDSVSTTLFTIPTEPFKDELEQGIVSDNLQTLFDMANYPLPANATVSPGNVANQSWVLASATDRFRYQLLEEGDSIGVHRVAGDWTVIVADRMVIFQVEGRSIFSYAAPNLLTEAAPELFFGNHVAISRLATSLAPQVETSFQDSCGNEIQLQALADNRMVVSQTIWDSMGRSAVRTKSAYITPDVNPLLTYCTQFASLNWTTGQMTGLVNDAYPDDEGFPYARERYEPSPLARVVEQGAPGKLFSIGAHSTSIAYTGDDEKFLKNTTTNPNGDVFFELQNGLDQTVSRVAIGQEDNVENQTIFDDAGNPGQQRSPNYFSPPTDSTAADWVDTQTFDYGGRVISSQSGKQGTTYYIYDPAGNLRFMQDPQGAQSGHFNYVKYDVLNRSIETGYLVGQWDAQTLQKYADTQPDWPSTPLTWRKKYDYDGGQTIKFAIGRITQVQVNNTDDGKADIIEQFRYDILGNTTTKTIIAEDFDSGVQHSVDYEYNNLGMVTRIIYPATSADERFSLYYRSNRLQQLSAIAETADFSQPMATFSYRANGQPLEETMLLGDELVKQTFDFNSPLWLKNIKQENSANETLFGETLSYTEGGFNDAQYYDGTIASTTFTGTSDDAYKYSYNNLGAIENADNQKQEHDTLGVTKSVEYDANGNFDLFVRGAVERQYNYVSGTQRVQTVCDVADDSVLASYSYDQNGNTTTAKTTASGLSSAQDLTFTYDPGIKMTTQIVNAVSGGKTLAFRYGHDNGRVQKDVWQNSQLIEKKLYIRDLNGMPLCELTTDVSSQVTAPTVYIYSPSGVMMMRRDDQTYGILKDHLGSVRVVLDQKATIVAKYDYLPFGMLSAFDEPSEGFMSYLFTGQEFDWECGLYNYRARFYSAELGRFLEVDPQKQFFSPYIYSANNPVLFVDPTGSISTWARVLFGVGMAIVGVGVIVATIATGGAASPAVAAWAAGLGASATVASAAGTVAAVAVSATLGAASGAALGSAFYALGTSNEDFSWSTLGQQAALGAIAGAITGGVGQGLSIGGQAIATAATGISETGSQWAASLTNQALISHATRTAIVGGLSSAIAGATASGVSGAISNVWGLTDLSPSDMAFSILGGLGKGAVKGAGGGVGGAAFSARIKAPALRVWASLSTKQTAVGGTIGGVAGVATVGGAYGYLYNRELEREGA
ncbi:rhs family protein [Leptolyngbya sp. Heron Island J]|uniref:RHS repeat-associated core domain-containing protein n=1 Tax=Leptolyngbya sp. Heron Island J TaxID=1385935 RepID=UPI0003B96513|nr:RHS repeat-associated core domain-containing protein [Leptolyngbya sp. Heron Island J]ESA38708.1 rhs family protein [Leptolyngbya sp. Heron Island J]